MGALLLLLFKEHGGKTMTGGILLTLLVGSAVMDAMGVSLPIPATRAYVDQAITTGTKGLDYIVRQTIEADVDMAAYEVQCMGENWKQSQLNRLKEQYYDLVGTAYVDKNCAELERLVQRMEGQVR